MLYIRKLSFVNVFLWIYGKAARHRLVDVYIDSSRTRIRPDRGFQAGRERIFNVNSIVGADKKRGDFRGSDPNCVRFSIINWDLYRREVLDRYSLVCIVVKSKVHQRFCIRPLK